MARIGPVLLTTVGDTFTQACRINAIVWVGSTTAGQTAIISCPVTAAVLWEGRTDTTNTYLGGNFGERGVPALYGFRASQLPGGKLYVYLRED